MLISPICLYSHHVSGLHWEWSSQILIVIQTIFTLIYTSLRTSYMLRKLIIKSVTSRSVSSLLLLRVRLLSSKRHVLRFWFRSSTNTTRSVLSYVPIVVLTYYNFRGLENKTNYSDNTIHYQLLASFVANQKDVDGYKYWYRLCSEMIFICDHMKVLLD